MPTAFHCIEPSVQVQMLRRIYLTSHVTLMVYTIFASQMKLTRNWLTYFVFQIIYWIERPKLYIDLDVLC